MLELCLLFVGVIGFGLIAYAVGHFRAKYVTAPWYMYIMLGCSFMLVVLHIVSMFQVVVF